MLTALINILSIGGEFRIHVLTHSILFCLILSNDMRNVYLKSTILIFSCPFNEVTHAPSGCVVNLNRGVQDYPYCCPTVNCLGGFKPPKTYPWL